MNVVDRRYNTIYVAEGHATCNISIHDDSWYIGAVHTHRDHLRKGYALRMLKIIVRAARKVGKRVYLTVGAYGHRACSNTNLLTLYGKAGFKVVEPLNDYYQKMEFVP